MFADWTPNPSIHEENQHLETQVRVACLMNHGFELIFWASTWWVSSGFASKAVLERQMGREIE
jgi:hypothetical protein